MIFVVLLVFLLTLVYYAVTIRYKYWEKRKVPGPKPTFLLGNMGPSLIMKEAQWQIYDRIYRAYPRASIVGIYRMTTPVLIIRDPELIKDMTIRHFSYFHDNDIVVDKEKNLLFAKHPFGLKGEAWKMVRSQLSSGFTSGKLKWLYPLLEDIGENLVKFIHRQVSATNVDGYEAKELSMKFTLNSVASCAFGLEGKCFEEENPEFRQLATDFFSPGSWTAFLTFVASLFPAVSKVFPIQFTSQKAEKKLIEIVTASVKYREENNIVRKDFLQILIGLKKSCTEYKFTDLDVAAHAAGFFGDGYKTSAVLMSFIMYHLASNTEAQRLLKEEVEENFKNNNNKLPYDVLQSMPYLDAVVNETLRISPPALVLQKLCTKAFTFTPKDAEKPLTIQENTPIIISLNALHTNAEYFEDPNTFKPERFLGANRETIVKCSYMPFGEGPRACLGQRFGVLQVKVGIAHIMKNFALTVNKKTKLPLTFDPIYLLLNPIGGLWIDFKSTT